MQVISRAQAKEQGIKRYYTGKPCKHGHVAERQVSNHTCIACLEEEGVRLASNARAKKWREENKERDAENHAAYAAKTKYWLCKARKDWILENYERVKKSKSIWAKNNPEKIRSKSRARQAGKIKATPQWSDRYRCDAVYAEAARLEAQTGQKYHVDHIVPLNSKIVCGLHVPENLRAIPAIENIRKHNRHWPDMPD
jgi:HrpA-like RNA helicase